MELKKEEVKVLRTLANTYMEIASLPVQREKMEQWKAFNRHDGTRPMVLIDQLPWHELNRDGELTCVTEDPFFRDIEFTLRSTIYKWKHFPVDMVVEPFLTIPFAADNSGYGLKVMEKTAVTDKDNAVVSHAFRNQLAEEEDLEKIRDMVITHDKARSREWREAAEAVFGGILPVRQAGGVFIRLGIWDELAELMGVEAIYYDLLDRPEFIHRIMEKMTHSALEGIRQVNEMGLVDTSANTCHCSVIYNDSQLPDFGAGRGTDTKNAWNFGLAQLFTSVSPEVTEEFEVPYISRLASEYGMIYYGCCDRLDDRLSIITKIPHVKKISCSPWSRREEFAEELPKEIVMSAKPSPAFLAGESLDEEEVRADLQRTCRAARKNGVSLELILKDVSTVRYEPQRLERWARLAMETVERFG